MHIQQGLSAYYRRETALKTDSDNESQRGVLFLIFN